MKIDYCYWHITQKCGNNCFRCRLWLHPPVTLRDAPYEARRELLAPVKEAGVLTIHFIGAEPLLSEDLFPLAKAAHSLNITTKLTCAITYIRNYAQHIIEHIDMLTLTLDGLIHEMTCESARGLRSAPGEKGEKASFDDLADIIDLFRGGKPWIRLAVDLSSDNGPFIEKILQISEEHQSVVIPYPVDRVSSPEIMERLRLHDRVRFRENYQDCFQRGGNDISNPLCRSNKRYITISPDNGLYYPCMYRMKSIIPLHGVSLDTMLKGSDFNTLQKEVGRFDFCSNCLFHV